MPPGLEGSGEGLPILPSRPRALDCTGSCGERGVIPENPRGGAIYFDYYQGPPDREPKAIGGLVPLDKVLRYEPIPAALDREQAKHVLGAQAQLWGEFISTPEHRFYMTYPRACALAEVLWAPRTDRDDAAFQGRLHAHAQRLRQMQVRYRPW